MYKEELDYQKKYGSLPDEKDRLLEYIKNNFKIDEEKLNDERNKIKKIKWKEITFTLPLVPKPSPRPRYSFKNKNFYVIGANRNKKIIEKYIEENIIYTRTKLYIRTYQPTPLSSMKKYEIYLAEEGLIVPIQNPD